VRITDFSKFQAISSTVSHVAFRCWYKIIPRAVENTLVGYRVLPCVTVGCRVVPWITVWCHGLPCGAVGYRVVPWATVSGLR